MHSAAAVTAVWCLVAPSGLQRGLRKKRAENREEAGRVAHRIESRARGRAGRPGQGRPGLERKQCQCGPSL